MSYLLVRFLRDGVPGADPMRKIHVRLAKGFVKLQSIGMAEFAASEKCIKEMHQRGTDSGHVAQNVGRQSCGQ